MALNNRTDNPNWNAGADTNVATEDGKKYRRVMSAGTLAGDRVRNSAGEDLGKVEEIMLDVETGRVAYAVLSYGGFLGMGSKLFAVPWQALRLDEVEHEFRLDVDKQKLESAPGFDKDNWPDMSDQEWGSQIFSHYGYTPYWETDSGVRDRDFDAARTTSTREKMLRGGNY
jgi:sporulation protein YlmC with PRC-barrel domain